MNVAKGSSYILLKIAAKAGAKAGAEAAAQAATKAATEVATKTLKEALLKLTKLSKPVSVSDMTPSFKQAI